MKKKKDPERFSEGNLPEHEKDFRIRLEEVTAASSLSNYEKFLNFPVFSSRQTITQPGRETGHSTLP